MTDPVEPSQGRLLAAGLVYGVLACWVATIYMTVLVADGLGRTDVGPEWWAHVIAVTLIAMSVEPVRRWLRRAVDDVVYGHHDDVFDVMTRLTRQIDPIVPGATSHSQPSVAQTIARSFTVPYVAIIDGDTETSSVGRRPADRDTADVPVTYQGEVIGHLLVSPRHPGARLSNRDLSLLGDLAHQLGVGMYAVRVSAQLQASRAEIVTAREEERRRIRRDLHDGLGPTLASMKLQLHAVQRLLDPEPAKAAALLGEVREEMDQTTAEIRRLVYGLRPPLIDELGLIAALRNHPAAHAGLTVTVRPDSLPELPAAVEVALYRIAAEAIHNVARHSGGARCDVTLDVDSAAVRLTVRDDGRGLPEALVEGVGMAAMRERAAELGGSMQLSTGPGEGATMATIIPLGRSS